MNARHHRSFAWSGASRRKEPALDAKRAAPPGKASRCDQRRPIVIVVRDLAGRIRRASKDRRRVLEILAHESDDRAVVGKRHPGAPGGDRTGADQIGWTGLIAVKGTIAERSPISAEPTSPARPQRREVNVPR